MKTNPSLVRVILTTVGHWVGFLFGRISWTAPPWLARFGASISPKMRPVTSPTGLTGDEGRSSLWVKRFKSTPRPLGRGLGLLALVGVVGWLGLNWWQAHRPRTFNPNPMREVNVTAEPPAAVTPGSLDKDLTPSPLIFHFDGAPAAPLERIGKDAAGTMVTQPKIAGKWSWKSGSTLIFQPDAHWPPDTKIHFKIRPAALAAGLQDRKSVV